MQWCRGRRGFQEVGKVDYEVSKDCSYLPWGRYPFRGSGGWWWPCCAVIPRLMETVFSLPHFWWRDDDRRREGRK
ncbi:hypothetical protein JMJ77_0002707 [Colletotrichum scovillei]|uniref:Uncharacterized protein n=1 Tax=Colletotrichum scovillei TaxID=1209932 RepID=A0A9P7UDL9_9PEZI|nr:hypothetical protein JMJ77_0002707 [Colletotrichum scovillei]KAG7071132.1 hypothetical protein JMJ76_0002369 [Colletotrichum scovillei]KAG7079407.1 hypothetical protein JMJ78_0003060 [Colletotrichum scovillei]